ncbi:hypothetical protein PoB_000071300 [Plakobranchus ocellatus]|uniref:Uncharacterized protein n=1 Tax=Plakobranchus ocellatus TaxID=259542 RepID=A0AAV3XV24_9GAST|nr:hypothetical protein PoB_000071300 [Plakobranchus ocellatus]
MGMSWRQGRKHGALLKKVGVLLENEKSVRNLTREIVSNFVDVGKKKFIGEDGNEFEETYARVAGLEKFVDTLLDLYNKTNMLTWHNNTIPENEIWVQFGGDHGKSSLKCTLQIANLDKPNSQHNTVVVAMASVRDTHTNLVRFLDGGLGDELSALQSHVWQGKKIKVFLNGDYDFLCKVYGLSGPQGTYPCLWCLMPRQTMHKEENPSQERTLGSLSSDHHRFPSDDSNKREVAKYNNSLHQPLLPIELDKVVPPYLHILLGIVLKHHKFLENAADVIDKKIMNQPEERLTELGRHVKRYGANWQKAQQLQERLEFEHGCLVFSETEEDIKKYTAQTQSTEHALSLLEHTDLKPRSGPVASSLDTILNKHRITPQAYHSRSFVGNHCHKYMNVDTHKDLTQILITKTQACTNNPMIVDEAFQVKLLFDDLNLAFSKVHTDISHTKLVNEESIDNIQKNISTYLTLYRRLFPQKIIPKQHILEHHCISHIKQYKLGLGLLGEQGTESCHQSISYLEKVRARGIVDPTQKLRHIMTTHLVNILARLRVQ